MQVDSAEELKRCPLHTGQRPINSICHIQAACKDAQESGGHSPGATGQAQRVKVSLSSAPQAKKFKSVLVIQGGETKGL